MEEKSIITIPSEYVTLSGRQLTAIAKAMYDRSVSAIYYDKDLNGSFDEEKGTLSLIIDYYLYTMCCADNSINEKEREFLVSLNPKFDDFELEKEADNSCYELLCSFSSNDKLSCIARDVVRLTVIAAVIDSGSINEAESRYLHRLLDCVVL